MRGNRWKSRPVRGAILRTFVFLAPLAASFAAGAAVSSALPRPSGVGPTVLWWCIVIVASFLPLFLVERAVRRLIPLAVLLKLTLVFPDRAPSRYRVARRTGNIRELKERLERARERGEEGLAEVAESIVGLATALSSHDKHTRGHSERVRVFTDLLADEMRVPPGARDRLRWAALLHDIGKLTVPQKILNKDGPLNEREWDVIHDHPRAGMRFIGPLAGWLGEWAATIEEHHERVDGTGYPAGLAGDQISLGARIVSVADAYDSMTAWRAYRKPLSAAAAREEVYRNASTQFDPSVARALMNVSLGQLYRKVGPVSWLAQVPFFGPAAQALGRFGEAVMLGSATAAAALATLSLAGAITALGYPAPQAHSAVVRPQTGHPAAQPHTSLGADVRRSLEEQRDERVDQADPEADEEVQGGGTQPSGSADTSDEVGGGAGSNDADGGNPGGGNPGGSNPGGGTDDAEDADDLDDTDDDDAEDADDADVDDAG